MTTNNISVNNSDDRPSELKQLLGHLSEKMPPLTEEEQEILQRLADRLNNSNKSL